MEGGDGDKSIKSGGLVGWWAGEIVHGVKIGDNARLANMHVESEKNNCIEVIMTRTILLIIRLRGDVARAEVG